MKNYNKICTDKNEQMLGLEDSPKGNSLETPEETEETLEVETPKKEWVESPKVYTVEKITNCKHVNLRSEPNKESKVLSILKVDDKVEVEDSDVVGWCIVRTKNKLTGYIMSDYITK